ncbi:MAG: hypothetical protein CMI96_00405 [Pelagibacteraceae bacterium]|nr:hypothetical protein [Pelagibacteraceae bacterium]
MFKVTIFIFQALLLLIILSFLFSNEFIVSFDIGDFKYSFNSNLLIGSIIAILFFLYLIQYIFFKSRYKISNYLLNTKYKKIEKGYSYFVEAMIALANKDNKNAVIYHKKMNNYLKDGVSLSLLLKSEVLKIEKNNEALSKVYEVMIKSKNTEALGLRGLMEQNLNNQDYHHAFLYGERLFFLNPKIEKLYDTLINIIVRTKNWNQMISISDHAYNKKIIDKFTLNENKSIAYYEMSKIKFDSDINDSSKLIQKALHLKKNFTPYIKLYLEIIAKQENSSRLTKFVKKYWFEYPNSSLRNILIEIIQKNNLGSIDFVQNLVKHNYSKEESKKLLIYFAIKNENWDLARNTIKGLIGTNPSKEICNFMSDIEIGEFNDMQKSDAWKLRAQNAPLENLWICRITNKTQTEWEPLSISGYFNSLEWKQPKMLNQLS